METNYKTKDSEIKAYENSDPKKYETGFLNEISEDVLEDVREKFSKQSSLMPSPPYD